MLTMWKQSVTDFIQREDGPTAVEYAVMLALIIVVCLTAISTLGNNANTTFKTCFTSSCVHGSKTFDLKNTHQATPANPPAWIFCYRITKL